MESINNNFSYNLLHILIIFFIIVVIYLHIKHINVSLIFDNENYAKPIKTVRKNKVVNKEKDSSKS